MRMHDNNDASIFFKWRKKGAFEIKSVSVAASIATASDGWRDVWEAYAVGNASTRSVHIHTEMATPSELQLSCLGYPSRFGIRTFAHVARGM